MARPIKKQVVTEASKVPGITPLDYMLSVIRDSTATQERRDKMSIAAAPYCHARLTEAQPKGKKEQQSDAALMAGMGTQWSRDLEFGEDRAN